ncbi:MAG: cohesin domain-containing protein [Thermoplasmatales archaeon]|nr:cohesin domain-containing protein [Thermoplasmatales archaeon]
MKKLLSLLIILLSISTVQATPSISIESLSASQENTVVYPLIIANAENIGAVQLKITFDPKVIRINSASNSGFGSFIPNTDTSSLGYIAIGAFDISDKGLSGNIKLADIVIQVIGKEGDSTQIKIEDFSAWDNKGAKISDYSVKDGSLNVIKKQEGTVQTPVIITPNVTVATPAATQEKIEGVTPTGTGETPIAKETKAVREIPGFEAILIIGVLGVYLLKKKT